MESLPAEPALLLAETALLLKQVLGAKIEVVDHTIITRKEDYVVMIANVRQPSLQLLLKLAGPRAPIASPFGQSAFLHHLVSKQTTISMPEILAADSSYRTWPWRYLIRTCEPGVEWAEVRNQLSVKEVAELHTQFGDAVAQLHNIAFSTFGEFTTTGEVENGKQFGEALHRRASSTIHEPRLRALFLSLLAREAELFVDVAEATLCHEDLHHHNLLLHKEDDRWQLITILDFDKAWAGCPESDLARLELWDGMTSASFWQAYQARRVISPFYEQRRPIFQLLWCLEYARNTEKHLAVTNRLCRALRLPLIEKFA